MPYDLDNEPIFQKAFGTAELAGLSVEQRAIYEENLIQILENEKCFGNSS